MEIIKKVLKRILPAPSRTFHRETGRLNIKLDHILNQIAKLEKSQQKQREQADYNKKVANEVLWGAIAKLEKSQQKQREQADYNKKVANEVLWGAIFNNTIADSAWLQNHSFSPGRWAAGYQFLYVLYRVLNEMKPRNILELGLGQTTRMIAQYASDSENAEHTVVEHDITWISFFERDFLISPKTRIVNLPLGQVSYFDDNSVTVYEGFGETFSDKKFDMICIDGPFGFSLDGSIKTYARIDVLQILPECLCPSFVILIDDYDRLGEQNTVKLIKQKLDEKSIEYSQGRYEGIKQVCIITSKDLHWLCSM